MKIIRKNVYYCEFCKKSGCAAGHMAKHERRCTRNPNRECGVCRLIEGELSSEPVAGRVALLPDPAPFVLHKGSDPVYSEELTAAANAALQSLRLECEDCPACILAAIRQSGIPVWMVSDFDYRSEMENVWQEVKESRWEGVGQ